MLAASSKLGRLRALLDQHLFPPAPPSRGRLSRWELALVVAGLFALAIVLELVRVGWQGSLQSLWAEDGPIFLQEAFSQSLGESLFDPYSNYFVVVPRLIGEAASVGPLESAPAVVSILSAALAALSGLVVWFAAAAHIRSPYLRGGLVVATVLVPVGGLESTDSAAYASWYMLFACFWILLWRPATNRGTAFACLFLLVTALSNPGVWFLAPLAGLRLLAARGWRDLAIVATLGVGALVQLVALATNDEPTVDPGWTHQILTAYLQRVVDGAVLGLKLGGVAWDHLGWPLLIVLMGAGAWGAYVGLRRASTGARLLALVALPTSLVLFVVSLYQRALGPEMAWPDGGPSSGAGGRYAIVPVLLVISVALVLIDNAERRQAIRTRLSRAGAVALLVLAVAVGTSFYVGNTEARGTPEWDVALDDAAASCAAEGLDVALVPTSPPGFAMALSCEEISAATGAEPAPGSP